MSPTTFKIDYDKMWKQLKGGATLGGINMSWDLTDGLSKEEWIRKTKKIFEPSDIFISKSGKLIIPKFGIY